MSTERFDKVPSTWLITSMGCGLMLLAGICITSGVLVVGMMQDDTETPEENVPLPPVLPSIPSPNGPGVVPNPPSPNVPAPSVPPPNVPQVNPPGQPQPWHIQARVTEVEGLSNVRIGSTCEFNVARIDRPDRTFWCNAQITCAGQLLYGGQNAGYFDCTLYDSPERHVVGEDPMSSRQDRDAAMRLNTLANELTIHDDQSGPLGRYRVRATITETR